MKEGFTLLQIQDRIEKAKQNEIRKSEKLADKRIIE